MCLTLSFTPTIMLENAGTFIKAAAFANRSSPPEHNRSKIHLHISPWRLQPRARKITHMLKHMCCRDAAAPLFLSGFLAPWLTLKSERECVHACVCEGEREKRHKLWHKPFLFRSKCQIWDGKQFVHHHLKIILIVQNVQTRLLIPINAWFPLMPQTVTGKSGRTQKSEK